MVLAGAGSGKTRVLAHRIAYIIKQRLAQPWQILAVTFTNKAARELQERVTSIAEQGDKVAAGTFHSIMLRLLRREAKEIDYPHDFSVFDHDDSVRLVKIILDDFSEDRFRPAYIHAIISRLKNDLITPELYSEDVEKKPLKQIVSKVYTEYESRLQKYKGMDFDDLLIRPVELFQSHPSVLRYWSNRWRYLHVDEFQDTNRAQFELVKILGGPDPNLFVVGDDDQSIYSWRGARVENIFQFRDHYKDVKVFRLERNYRSTQPILNIAHSIVVRSRRREAKKLWTEKNEGMTPKVIQTSTEQDEAREIVDRISENVLSGKRQYSDHAIFYRTNAQSRVFEDALRARRIPHQIIGSLKFYERKEVKDVLAYWRICLNPSDEVSLRRLIKEPPRGIGESSLEKLIHWSRGGENTLFEAFQQATEIPELSTRAINACQRFGAQIVQWRSELKTNPLDQWAKKILKESGYLDRLQEEKGFEAETRLNNVQELLNSLSDFIKSEEGSLNEFLENVTLATDIDSFNENQDNVRLMTLHSAKGLEFPVVFISGIEQGLIPMESSNDRVVDEDEERRLFYVGVTRAREELFLTYAKQRQRWGQVGYSDRSQFLMELPRNSVDWDHSTSVPKPRSSTLPFSTGDTKRLAKSLRESDPPYRSKIISRPRDESEQTQTSRKSHEYQDTPAIHRGDLVEHPTFGKGIVISTSPFYNDIKLEVDFNGERIILMQGKARLKPLKDFS